MHPVFVILIVIGSIVAATFIVYLGFVLDARIASNAAKIEAEKAQAQAMIEAQRAREMAKIEAEFPTEMSKGRTCERCGAPLTSNVCEYCGTKYDFKRVQVSFDNHNK